MFGSYTANNVASAWVRQCNTYSGGGVDVADVSSDTGGEADIEEAKLGDEGVVLQEKGELWQASRRVKGM